jgi:hypothetical protein
MIDFVRVWWPLMLVAAGACWLLRDRLLGGWLLFFLFSMCTGLGLSAWRLYETMQTHRVYSLLVWDVVAMFAIVLLTAISFAMRDPKWVSAVRLALLFKAAIVFALVFRRAPMAAPFSVVITMAWWLYFGQSKRVRRAFPLRREPQPEKI